MKPRVNVHPVLNELLIVLSLDDRKAMRLLRFGSGVPMWGDFAFANSQGPLCELVNHFGRRS